MIKNLLRKNKPAPFLCAALVCLLALSACKKDQPPPAALAPKPAPVQAKAVQKPVSSAQAAAAPAVNQFDFSKKKDPFRPLITVKAAPADNAGPGGKPLRNALPLHSFDVNQFKLIGIITGGKDSQAMVTDPGGKGYVLKTGMTIGKNGGKVAAITSRSVDVVEQFRDDNGRVRSQTIKLTLPRKQ